MFHCSHFFFLAINKELVFFLYIYILNMAINQELVFVVTIVDDKLLSEGKTVNEVTFKFHQ